MQADDPLAAIEAFFDAGLTDGLPIVPPTQPLVSRFLEKAGLKPDEVIGRVPARSLAISAQAIAVNAVMAGCRPEYLPVVIACVEGLCDEAFNIHGASVSTGGSAVLVIVNGPVRKALGMNSGANVLGPGNRANSTIGRAIRLITMNVIGSAPGTVDLSCLGHGGKYSYCLPEAEEVSPWEPLHVEKGFPPEASTVTVINAQGAQQVHDQQRGGPESILGAMADSMAACGPGFAGFVVVLGPESAGLLARAGYAKKDIKGALYARAERTARAYAQTGKLPEAGAPGDEAKMVKAVESADGIMLVVAGGQAGRFNAIIPPWSRGQASIPQTRVVRRMP